MRSVKVTLGLALALCAAAVVITLSRSPVTVARTNVSSFESLQLTSKKIDVCQAGETVPAHVSAIRLRILAFVGPRVTVSVLSDGRLLTRGERGSGWTGGVVTVPVKPLAAGRSGVKVCFRLYSNGKDVHQLVGELATGAAVARGPSGVLPGRMGIEYIRPSPSSWWSSAPDVIRRLGLGHAVSGVWNALVVLLLMGALVLLCVRLTLRELG